MTLSSTATLSLYTEQATLYSARSTVSLGLFSFDLIRLRQMTGPFFISCLIPSVNSSAAVEVEMGGQYRFMRS